MKNWRFAQIIVNWQHENGRNNLPWQNNNNPYFIWVSEIMLQQTQVKTVIPYFKKFINKFNTIQKLSQSHLNQVLHLWSGLGYYHRAHNMYKTAKIIVNEYNGKFPNSVAILIKFPGIGKTTAHAILSLTYNFTLSILDSNVKRIITRFYNCKNTNVSKTQHEKKLWKLIDNITPVHHAKKFNQGMMDLGALVCSYKEPKCNICPIKISCQYDKYTVNNIKNIKNIKKNKKCYFYIIVEYKKKYFLQYRKKHTIWKKLFCFPEFYNLQDMKFWLSKNIKYNFDYKKYYHVKSTFSHFVLKMICIHIFLKKKISIKNENYIWYDIKNQKPIGLPKPINNILLNIHNNN